MNAAARRWILFAAILVACPRLLGCGVGGATPQEYRALVMGPAGGVASAQNVTLKLPPGALTEDTTVRLLEQPAPLPIEPQVDRSVLTYHDNIMCIGPLGITLAAPGRMRMCYPVGNLPPGRSESDLRLLEWDEAAGTMRVSTTAVQNLETHCFEEVDYRRFGHVAVALRTPGCRFDVRLKLKNIPQNLVDVFLLLDDSDSFGAAAPAIQSGFVSLVATLQASFPDVDFAFGVGRFEDYGGPGSDFSGDRPTSRPFVLNQPILATTDGGFSAALSTALATPSPGFGGDRPESVFEALYQVATGAGFDGDGNGSRLDSGAAGAASTQSSPGTSGDVPPFASNVAATSGSLGGVGFRAGSTRLVLLATGSSTIVPFDGAIPASISGTGGTVAVSQLAGTSTTPGAARFGLLSDATSQAANTTAGAVAPKGAATAQAAIEALNAMGIRVVGLTNQAGSSGAPVPAVTGPDLGGVALLQAIATLTGAVDDAGTALVYSIAVGDRNQSRPIPLVDSDAEPSLQSLFDQTEGGLGSMGGNPFIVSGPANDQSGQAVWFPAGSGSTTTIVVEFAGYSNEVQFGVYSQSDGSRVLISDGPETAGASHTFTFTPGFVQIDAQEPVAFDLSTGFGFYLEYPDLPFLRLTDDAKNPNPAHAPGNEQAIVFQGKGGGQTIETANGVIPLTPLDWVIGFEDVDSRSAETGEWEARSDFQDFVCVVQGLLPADPSGVEASLVASIETALRAKIDVELSFTSGAPCLQERDIIPIVADRLSDGDTALFTVVIGPCPTTEAAIELRDARSGALLAIGTVVWDGECPGEVIGGSTEDLQIEPAGGD